MYLEVFGQEEGQCSGERRLVFPAAAGRQPFQRGAADAFQLRCPDLGELWKV